MDIDAPDSECSAHRSTRRSFTGEHLDSASQMGNADGADWQEETYQKIKSMREKYLSELDDLYQKIASKVQQHDSVPLRPQNEQIEKLKMFMMTLERIVLFLQLNKHDIQLTHKEKLFSVERHISFFLSSKRPREPSSPPLLGQLPQSSMQLQPPQSLDVQTNPPMQPVHGSMAAMQQNNLTNLQHLSLSGVKTVQPGFEHLDSASQMGNADGADWQEETYQKIKSMREKYLSELDDLYQKIASKVQQHDSVPQRPQNEQIEKLKMFMMTLERIMLFLQLNKHDIQLTHKEKLFSVERHISFFLSSKRPREPSSPPLLGQLPQSSMQLQPPQSLDVQTNPPTQPVHGSMAAMQQNNLTNLQHLSLSGVNTVQPGSGVATGILPQNPVNYSPQQVNISSLSSQSGTNPVQANIGSLQQNSSIPQQSLFELHEHQMLQDQQLRQMYEQMQQQTFHSQQLMQHQQLFHRNHLMQQQAMQQQLMQQQIVQLRAHQMSRLHQVTDANDLMMRQQIGMNTGVLQQQQSVGQRVGSLHPQIEVVNIFTSTPSGTISAGTSTQSQSLS